MTTERTPYTAGYTARFTGQPLSANLHWDDAPEFRDWREGWFDSREDADALTVHGHSPATVAIFMIVRCHLAGDPAVTVDDAYDVLHLLQTGGSVEDLPYPGRLREHLGRIAEKEKTQ